MTKLIAKTREHVQNGAVVLKVCVLFLMMACAAGAWQEDSNPGQVAGKTLRDLQTAKPRTTFSQIQKERLQRAIVEVQQLLDRLQKDGFVDKPKLEEVIGDVEFVIQHNPIQETIRMRLEKDVSDLRRVRETSAVGAPK